MKLPGSVSPRGIFLVEWEYDFSTVRGWLEWFAEATWAILAWLVLTFVGVGIIAVLGGWRPTEEDLVVRAVKAGSVGVFYLANRWYFRRMTALRENSSLPGSQEIGNRPEAAEGMVTRATQRVQTFVYKLSQPGLAFLLGAATILGSDLFTGPVWRYGEVRWGLESVALSEAWSLLAAVLVRLLWWSLLILAWQYGAFYARTWIEMGEKVETLVQDLGRETGATVFGGDSAMDSRIIRVRHLCFNFFLGFILLAAVVGVVVGVAWAWATFREGWSPLERVAPGLVPVILLTLIYLAGPSWSYEVQSAVLQENWLFQDVEGSTGQGSEGSQFPAIVGALDLRHGSPLAAAAAIASAAASVLLGSVLPV